MLQKPFITNWVIVASCKHIQFPTSIKLALTGLIL